MHTQQLTGLEWVHCTPIIHTVAHAYRILCITLHHTAVEERAESHRNFRCKRDSLEALVRHRASCIYTYV